MSTKKKKISYEDYKYEYTGYKDYCKNHNIKIKSDDKIIKKEKIVKQQETIDHDHRLVFDFNNPNQHTHDYSFDFNTQKTPTKKTTTTNTTRTYQQTKTTYPTSNTRTTTTTYTPNSTKTTNTSTYNKTQNINVSGCAVSLIFIFIIFFFFIIGIISESSYDDDYYDDSYYYDDDYDYDYDYDYNYETNTDSYTNAVKSYTEAIRYSDYTLLLSRITPQEEHYNGGIAWLSDISSLKNIAYPVTTLTYSYTKTEYLSASEISYNETLFNNKYGSNITMTAAYYLTLNIKINDIPVTRTLHVAKIKSYWYLIEVK